MPTDRRNLIVRDPSICNGQATIQGTRIMVSIISDRIAAGMTEADIIDDYPSLSLNLLNVEGIRAAAAHGAELARDEYPAVASA